jgi:hypothetical protein
MVQSLEGLGVQLRNKTEHRSDNQIWTFTTTGYIVSEAYKTFALTSLATIIPEDSENFVADGIRMNEDDPFISFVAICPQCLPNSPFIHRQR